MNGAPPSAAALIDWAEGELAAAGLWFGHGTDNARDEAAWLVLHAAGLPLTSGPDALEQPLKPAAATAVRDLVARRIRSGLPAAYLIGSGWFAGLEFEVDAATLIPRSPIAELVADRYAPWLDPARIRRVLDIGTGGGCIAIATAVAIPGARVDAVDCSARALAVARRNAVRHGVADRVEFILGDGLAPVADRRYDLVVSNPPYVPHAEFASLPVEYFAEPAVALDGGSDGMDLVARIVGGSRALLEPGGVLVLEVGGYLDRFTARFPGLAAVEVELAFGGEGVLVIDAAALPDG